LGLALAPARREVLASVGLLTSELSRERIALLIDGLRGVAGRAAKAESWLHARYRGQGHELEVPVLAGIDGYEVSRRFADIHYRRFGFTLELPVEIISARHAASGAPRAASLARRGQARWGGGVGLRDDGGVLDATVNGPASIMLPDATMLVTSGWTARALAAGGWEMTRP
jgi:N-methylhydantoinase A/oxoprolinase/acetone carboxylase beta subunit